MKYNQIASQSKYHDELGKNNIFSYVDTLEFEMPDRYHLQFLQENIIDVLI